MSSPDAGGRKRAEPTTPEQLAVTRPIRALFSALAADDAARACAQLTRSARSGRQPVLQGNGWLNCKPKPAYARDHADSSLWKSKVYDVTITGDHAEAEVPWGSDRFSPGWDFSLVRLGDRWLITRIADYNYVGG